MSVLITVIIYGAVLLYIGYRSYKGITGKDSFYLSEKKGSPAVITGSLLATIIGGSGTIGMAGLGYRYGLGGSWWLLAGTIGLAVLAVFLAKRVHSMNVITLPEILKIQYNSDSLRRISSVMIFTAWTGIITGQIIAAGKIISTLWPQYQVPAIVIAGIIFTIYTAAGGQLSILKTDFLQLILLLGGLGAVYYFAGASGDISPVQTASLPEGFFDFPVSAGFTWKNVGTYILFIGATYLIGPDIYSRIFCASSSRGAAQSVIATAFLLVPLAFLIAGTGILARMLLPGITAESALPALIIKTVPPGITVLVLLALLSALMSSADTCLMTAGTILVQDLYLPLSKREIPETKEIFYTRAVIVCTGIISILLGLYVQSIIGALLLAYTVYSSAFLVPVLLGFFRERLKISAGGAVLSVVSCGTASLFLKLFYPDYLLYIFPASFIILTAGSYIFPKNFPNFDK